MGCIKRVQLPEALPFPNISSQTSASESESVLRKQIDQKKTEIWKILEQHWRVKNLKGKFWVRLHFDQGKVTRCVWQRSLLEGSTVEQPNATSSDKQASSVCMWFQKQNWSQPVSTKTIILDHVVAD